MQFAFRAHIHTLTGTGTGTGTDSKSRSQNRAQKKRSPSSSRCHSRILTHTTRLLRTDIDIYNWESLFSHAPM